MTNHRLLAHIKSSLERSFKARNVDDLAQGLTALVQVQKDVISELEREVARLKLNMKYKVRKDA